MMSKKTLYDDYIVTLHLVREGNPEKAPQIMCSNDVAKFLKSRLRDESREIYIAIYLNPQHRVVGVDEVSKGSSDAAIIHPREVFKGALLANATCVITAHNHPSGNPTPSPDDRMIHERLKKAGELLGVKLLDELVIGDGDRFYSYADNGE